MSNSFIAEAFREIIMFILCIKTMVIPLQKCRECRGKSGLHLYVCCYFQPNKSRNINFLIS